MNLVVSGQASSMSSFVEVDAFIGNHTLIDPEIYRLWLDGYSTPEAVTILQQQGFASPPSTDLLFSDVMDQYRTYSMLEKYLHNPSKLMDQWIFQMDADTMELVISKYYDFDDIVMREILGKKLSSRQRKDLDEVSEKTNVNLKSCRRQFDNAKRVFKTVEEMSGSVVQNIQANFYLNDELARKYSAIVFIAENRFETNKRKLHYLTFQDYLTCALAMMGNWKSPIIDEDATADVEREFLMDLRELRVMLDKEKEHKIITLQKVKGRVTERIYAELESNFKTYSRTLVNLAYGLNHNKELRDLFIDLVEKYIDPCKQMQWPASDMKTFLEIFTESGLQLEVMKQQSQLRTVWKRYMDGITVCLVSMYHN